MNRVAISLLLLLLLLLSLAACSSRRRAPAPRSPSVAPAPASRAPAPSPAPSPPPAAASSADRRYATLPAGTNMVMALDLATLRADPHFAALYEMTLREWFGDFLGELTSECRVDPIQSVDHILVGGLGPTFLYRSAVVTGLDRAQVTTCLTGVAAKARAAGVLLHAVPFDGGIELRAPGEPSLHIGFLDDRTAVIVREQGRSAEREVVMRTVRARPGDGASADASLMAIVDRAAAEGSAWLVLGGATVASYGVPEGTSIRYVFQFGEHIEGRVVAVGLKLPADAGARLAADVERRLRMAVADPEMPIAVRREKIPGGVALAFTLPPVVLASLIDTAGSGGF